MNWEYIRKPKKDVKCLVCGNTGIVLDKKTKLERPCTLCANKTKPIK